MIRASLAVACLLAGMTIGMNAAQGAELKVLASPGVKHIVTDLVSTFETTSGHKVSIAWGGNSDILGRVRAGEAADLVVMARFSIDRLIAEGKLVAGSVTDIATSGIGVAVRAGLPAPDISSAEAVKNAVLAARTVAYSSGPSGATIAEILTRMGIADRIKDKVRQPPPATAALVGEMLARGEADLGFQLTSELIGVEGITYLGPLPAEIQSVTIFSAAPHPAAASPALAKALVDVLTGPEAAAVIRKAGMAPMGIAGR
jgi:molybdate transport system substrate-binding protein